MDENEQLDYYIIMHHFNLIEEHRSKEEYEFQQKYYLQKIMVLLVIKV